MTYLPRARVVGIVAANAGEEVVLHDSHRNHYHTLNATAQRIWRAADGTRSPRQIADLLGMPLELVNLGLADLSSLELVDRASVVAWIDRRAVVKRIFAAGTLGAIALPVIASISGVESVSAAVSCAFNGQPCRNGVCCPNHFCANGICVFD